MDWRKSGKIDVHVHLLPPERLSLFRESSDNPLACADMDVYLKYMEMYNVEKAVFMPYTNFSSR